MTAEPCYEEPGSGVFKKCQDLQDDDSTNTNKPVPNRIRWSEAEDNEIQQLFATFLKKAERPSTADIKDVMNTSENNGGLIHKRSLSSMKNKIFRMIPKEHH